jgi:hypothetical protein
MTAPANGDAPAGTRALAGRPPGEVMEELLQRLSRLELGLTAVLGRLATEQAGQAWYGTAELAALLGKDEFTVREWCRLGRVRAEKKRSGRGRHKAWAVSAAEVERYRREGLLPPR